MFCMLLSDWWKMSWLNVIVEYNPVDVLMSGSQTLFFGAFETPTWGLRNPISMASQGFPVRWYLLRVEKHQADPSHLWCALEVLKGSSREGLQEHTFRNIAIKIIALTGLYYI